VFASIAEAASVLGVTGRAVRRRAAKDDLPGAEHVGRSWIVPAQTVTTLLAARFAQEQRRDR
jgi:hypothetical protein